mgnify:CR=1 FL=1
MNRPTKKQKDRLKQIQALCDFAQKPKVTGIDVEHIFQVMEEPKVERIWTDDEAKSYQRAVVMSLYSVAVAIYHPDVRLEIAPPRKWQEVVVDGGNLRIEQRLTNVPNDVTEVRKIDSSGEIRQDVGLPYVVYRAIEILTELPVNTLRICGAGDCKNMFASLHQNRSYCSARCRNRVNTYATRRRSKDA